MNDTKERVPFTGLTDEDLLEVFGVDDTNETQDNGNEATEEQLTENDSVLQ